MISCALRHSAPLQRHPRHAPVRARIQFAAENCGLDRRFYVCIPRHFQPGPGDEAGVGRQRRRDNTPQRPLGERIKKRGRGCRGLQQHVLGSSSQEGRSACVLNWWWLFFGRGAGRAGGCCWLPCCSSLSAGPSAGLRPFCFVRLDFVCGIAI